MSSDERFRFRRLDEQYYEVMAFGHAIGDVYYDRESPSSYYRWRIAGDRNRHFCTRLHAAIELAVMQSGLIVRHLATAT